MSLSSDALPVMAVQPNCTSKDPNLHRIKLGNCIGQSVWTAVLSGSNCTHNVVVKKFHLPKDLPDEVIEDINLLSHYSKLGANLCTVHGCLVSDEGNDLFIVRDYCEESLHEVVVRSRKLTAEQTIRLGICIAKAVTDLHNFDIVCGNIKVSNILLNDNSDAFLSDYGLMKIMKDLGISMPTSDYPAPEIQSNELQNPSKESDMWSFGCTLLEMYTGDRSMIRDVISNLVNGKKTSIDLSIVPEDCPLGNIICQCLQADASSRPSCLDVLRILSRYVLKPKLNNRPRCITREEALSKLMYDLRTYASNDDDTAVRKLLRDVKNIQNLDILLNSKDINGETLLHWSLKMGSMKCVELLLQSGASPQSQDVEGESILHISIMRKNTDLAVKIMEKYPDSMGIMNHRNKTPLHLCIETSNTVLVSKWIDITNEDTRKHIIDVRGPAGTALCMAASIEKGQDLVHQLLKAGADPIITDNNNQSILHLAVMKDDRELAEILLNATQLIEARNGMGRTPLHIALSYTSMSCVRLLMDHGADWQLEDNEGNNAFHIAAYAIQCGRVSHFCDEPLSFIRMLPRLAEDNKIKRNYRGNTPLDILMLIPFDFICQEYGDELFSWGLDREICRRVKLRELYHPPPTGASGAKVTLQDKDLSCRLTDAKLAGGNWSLKCTLILTEGESAKMFAMSGICSVLGSNMFGVYALNGKPLNAEDHSKDICNPQLKHIACILGLEFGESNDSNLRYGSVMFMMDPDEDGCHIKGLLLAFFQNCFPWLLRRPGFFQDFETQLLVGNNNTSEKKLFKSRNDYDKWRHETQSDGWSFKYYKSLASYGPAETKEIFQNFKNRVRYFCCSGKTDATYLKMAFSKDKRSERRTWISQREIHPMPNLLTNQFISITDFVDDELVYYFAADCQRSIPSAMDGLKKTSRKVMFALLEKLEDESYPTVDSICGHITKHTAYHHRSSYMAQVIVNMARSFVGSNNNINLIAQGGQCGSREEKRGGNPFYVTTALNPISKLIFPQDDYVLLEHLNEDGMSVEPKTYMPIVPLILINGGFGMASGYKCDVPCYHPIDVIKSIRQLLEKSAPSPMTPYYRGFKGLVRSIALGKHAIEGVFENNGTKILIREIPIGKKFNEYRDFLESLKKKKKIKDYQQKGMEGNICFLVFLYQKKSDNEIKILLDLVIIHTTQLNLLDAEGNLVCYRSVEQFLDHFFEARMELYTRRKKHAINKIRLDIQHIDRELENTNSIRKKYFDLHDQKDILSFQLSTLENEKESEFEIAAWSKELDALEAHIKVLYGESGST